VADRDDALDQRVSIALAEFNALRAEIVSHSSAEYAAVGVGLTALAVIVGFVVKEGGDERLLLAIPPLALFINLVQAASNFRNARIATYIQRDLWPYLQGLVGQPTPPSWELWAAKRRRSVARMLVALTVDAAGILLFSIASAIAVVQARHLDTGLGDLGWVCCGLSIALPACLAVISTYSKQPRGGT
jgi:hypothetical protein